MKKIMTLFILVFSFLMFSTSYAAKATQTQFNTVIAAAQSNPQLTTFVKLVDIAGLHHVFQEKGPFTLFIPTNKAFSSLPHGLLQRLEQPKNQQKLRNLLLGHVLAGKTIEKDLQPGKFHAVNGDSLLITKKGRAIFLDDKAEVANPGISASNGNIHAINTVLIPKEMS